MIEERYFCDVCKRRVQNKENLADGRCVDLKTPVPITIAGMGVFWGAGCWQDYPTEVSLHPAVGKIAFKEVCAECHAEAVEAYAWHLLKVTARKMRQKFEPYHE